MKESRKFYKEKIWKILQLENVSKIPKWVNQVSIYRPRSSGHLASSKRSSGGFFIKKFGKDAISHELQQFRMSSNNFARLCEMEIASAPFSPSWRIMHDYAKLVFTSPLWAAAKILPLSISYVCANFSHVHAKLKNMVFGSKFVNRSRHWPIGSTGQGTDGPIPSSQLRSSWEV